MKKRKVSIEIKLTAMTTLAPGTVRERVMNLITRDGVVLQFNAANFPIHEVKCLRVEPSHVERAIKMLGGK